MTRAVIASLLLAVVLGGCGFSLTAVESSTACVGPYSAEAVCDEFIALASPAIQGTRLDAPSAVAVGSTCPPNARCMPSALGGDTLGVVAIWSDGAVAWATMDLPADWPDAPPGPPIRQDGDPPAHLVETIR